MDDRYGDRADESVSYPPMGATAIVVDALACMPRTSGVKQELAGKMRQCRQEIGHESDPYAVRYQMTGCCRIPPRKL